MHKKYYAYDCLLIVLIGDRKIFYPIAIHISRSFVQTQYFSQLCGIVYSFFVSIHLISFLYASQFQYQFNEGVPEKTAKFNSFSFFML